jgi:pimeloyl-ACP methyl ester carboxylesterase
MTRLKNKPVLIGHSMGGAVVQKVLQSNEDKIEAVVLMSSTPPQGMLKDMLRLVFTNFKKVSQLNSFNKGKTNKFPDGVFFSEELPAEKRDEFVNLLQLESDRMMPDSAREIIPKPININVQILVLGSKKDWFFPERTVMAFGKTYKTEPVIFPDVYHDMMLDPNWRIVADEILVFLNESISKNGESVKL